MDIAIITGASSGLGIEYLEAVTEKYSSLDEIWIVARRLDRMEELAKKYSDIIIRPIALDLASDDAYLKLGSLLDEVNPTIKILINNAGVEKTGRFDITEQSVVRSMIDLNVKVMTMVDHICIPFMKSGSFIIHTCSVSSFAPVPAQIVYSASKAYLRFFSRGLREEMKQKGINVFMMCPGNMDTEMNPKGQHSQSKMVDSLPFLNMKVITRKALIKAEAGKAMYTPGGFYKCYRAVTKILPSALMIKITGKSYDY